MASIEHLNTCRPNCDTSEDFKSRDSSLYDCNSAANYFSKALPVRRCPAQMGLTG